MALSVIYPPPGSHSIKINVDIVAVHGLNGDKYDTWTWGQGASKVLWLEKFLPQKIPDARVLTFGYNADVVLASSTADITDHARTLVTRLDVKRDQEDQNRPIVFIAHSLGGIVVKEALRQARENTRYNSICDSTIGIMFFGTPHHGSHKAKYGDMLAKIIHAALYKPDNKLLATLKQNSDALEKLTGSFRFLVQRYHLVSFYETRPTGHVKSLIVEPDSAQLQVEHEEQIPVDADHITMCKFQNEDDGTFEIVHTLIQRMRREPRGGPGTQQAASVSPPEPPLRWWKAIDGSTPMHEAAMMGDTMKIDRLRRQGHDVGVKRNDGSTPMHVAAYFGQIAMVNHLRSIKPDLLGAGNSIGMTPMHEAANNNQPDMISYLLSVGQQANVRRHDGSTPMHVAAYKGHKDMVDYLNSLGTDLGVRTNIGMTPMHEAANNDQVEMLDHLRARGQDVGVRRNDGSAPIHVAAFKGHIRMVDHLRDLGQDLGVKNNLGMTPIHEAANNNQIAMLDHLMNLGQDLSVKTNNGSTPLDIALSRGNAEVAAHIRHLCRPPSHASSWSSLADSVTTK